MQKIPLPQNQIANHNSNLKQLTQAEILTGYQNNHKVESNIHNYLFNRNGQSLDHITNIINDCTQNNDDLVPVDLISKSIPHLYYQFDQSIQRLDQGQSITDIHGNVYQLTRGWIKNNVAYSNHGVAIFENASFKTIKQYVEKQSPAPAGNGDVGYNTFARKMINSDFQLKLLSN